LWFLVLLYFLGFGLDFLLVVSFFAVWWFLVLFLFGLGLLGFFAGFELFVDRLGVVGLSLFLFLGGLGWFALFLLALAF